MVFQFIFTLNFALELGVQYIQIIIIARLINLSDFQVDILAVSCSQENDGEDKPLVKKRHMITSSSVDGRLITTIKAATGQGL